MSKHLLLSSATRSALPTHISIHLFPTAHSYGCMLSLSLQHSLLNALFLSHSLSELSHSVSSLHHNPNQYSLFLTMSSPVHPLLLYCFWPTTCQFSFTLFPSIIDSLTLFGNNSPVFIHALSASIASFSLSLSLLLFTHPSDV